MQRLRKNEILKELAARPGWEETDEGIRKTYMFDSFPATIAFVQQVAEAAEAQNHHPDIDIRYNRATLRLVTHDAGGLTQKDFVLADAADRIAMNS